MNKVSYGAWGATIIWVSIIGWVTYTKRGDFSTMELNAVGDFLAGTVSPLALIWLVAGYLQQGKELRLNTNALEAQIKELALQVASSKIIAENSTEQANISRAMHQFNVDETERLEQQRVLERERAIRPNIYVTLVEKYPHQWDLTMHNIGGDALNFKIFSGAFNHVVSPGDRNRIARDSHRSLHLNEPYESRRGSFLTICCYDCDNNFHEMLYEHDVVTNFITPQIIYEQDYEPDDL
jgi:hypothetical protein